MRAGVAATVAGEPVTIVEVDARERAVRARAPEHALPRPGTREARQLRRWLTQVLVAERVVAREAGTLRGADAPPHAELLPDTLAHMEVGSVAAATLADPVGRAVFARITAGVVVEADQVADYHARHPDRMPESAVAEHLCASARRRAYRRWLDARCAELVQLAPGYEHPGDPRQPDNTHTH
ncbi:malonyl CoA-ACP transacylase [Mycobacterium sp. Soil538]|nr:malonyl CoA-ACP transacylase [Mycobacterium sp. Soil538]